MQIRSFRTADLPLLIDLTIEVFGVFYEQSFRSMVPPTVFDHQHGSWADDYRSEVPTLHDPEQHKHVAVARRRIRAKTSPGLSPGASITSDVTARSTCSLFASRREDAGVGRGLCDHAITAMRAADVEVVTVGTGGDWFHAPARALYASLGFSLVPVAVYMRAL